MVLEIPFCFVVGVGAKLACVGEGRRCGYAT